MKSKKIYAYVLSSLLLVACGSDKEEEKEQDFEDAVSALSALGGAAASAMEADEALNNEEAEEAAEKIEKELINYKDLRNALPDEINGAEKVDESGETMKMGALSVSTGKKMYKNGEQRIDIEVMDYALAASMLKAAVGMSSMEVDSDDRYVKSFRMDDEIKGWEEYNKNNKSSNVTAVINNRLMVTVRVKNAEPGEALEILKEIDLDDLKELSE